jgi:5-methylcytosine-specific restriction endonuclease McrA
MSTAPVAGAPREIVAAREFIPSLSAHAVDVVLRRSERQAARARLLAATYLLDLAERRLFRQLGYSSVMHYGTQALGLSPRDVWDRLRVARALRELPAVAAALRAGRLSWSKVRELIRVATRETEAAWLERAARLSCRELEAAVAAETRAAETKAPVTGLQCRFVDEQTVRITVELTPEQFALLDQAIGTIRRELGTEDAADALELIARAYLARVGEAQPALRQQIVVHRCRDCRQEWRETSKGRVPAAASRREPTDLVEVDDPEEERELDRSSHVGTRAARSTSRYIPRSVVKNVRLRDEGRCQVPGCANGRWSQLHHIRFFSRGGRHRTRNLLTLCSEHHRQLHDGALVLRAGDAEGHRFTDGWGRGL